MKKCLLLFTVSFSAIYFAQTFQAVTDEGKEVILFADKTWKFVNESDEAILNDLPENEDKFLKERSSTFLVKSKKINTGLYIDPKKWQIKTVDDSPLVDYQFAEKSGNGYGLFGSEKSNIANYTIYKDILINTLQKKVSFFKLLRSEIRTVNDKKVLFLRYKVNIQNLDFEYVGYYMITEQGLSQVVCYSSDKMFEEFLPGFMQFLNGFVENYKTSTGSTVKETIEYSSPPPPMKKN